MHNTVINDISVSELKERLDHQENLRLIDVREPYEHDEFNIGGENLPLDGIMEWSDQLDADPAQEIVVYCRSGNRSAMAKSFLVSKGFSTIRNLTGGVLAWQKL